MKAIDKGGRVLTRAKIVLSFRGAGWGAASFTADEVRQAFEAALASPYASHLVQYRGIHRPEIVFVMPIDTSNLGTLGPDPRKFVSGDIWLISDDDVRGVVTQAAAARPPQDGEDVFYFVVISQDPIPIVTEHKDDSGYHGVLSADGRAFYGVALNQSVLDADGTAQYLPGVFTHEVVEACTDPNPRDPAFLLDLAGELADLNDTRPVKLPGVRRLVKLAAYWSNLAGVAVVPATYSLRVAIGVRPTERVASVRSAIGQTSVRAEILSRFNP